MKGNKSSFVENRSTDVAALSYEENMIIQDLFYPLFRL
jgi:hypothetical protein